MSRFDWTKLSLVFLFCLVTSCATYKEQHKDIGKNWGTLLPPNNSNIVHTFYFLGDGGKLDDISVNEKFGVLKQELSSANSNTTLLFLGDNIYEDGMPEKILPKEKKPKKY